MVFENYALYPHLSVFDNIAMPLWARKRPKLEIAERVAAIAAILSIEPQLHQRPGQLSGGQRQRVALARAMIRRPRMFLMDEPLGHLEAYLRVELRRQIRTLHEAFGGTTFYITHDQQEAAAVSDRIVVMADGELQQAGTIRELIDRPANRFVAEFVGEPPITIFADVALTDGGVRLGGTVLPLPERTAAAARRSIGRLALGVRPAAFRIGEAGSAGLAAMVRSVQPMGEWGAVFCDTPAGSASVVVPTDELPRDGAAVTLWPDPSRLHLFAADGSNLAAAEG